MVMELLNSMISCACNFVQINQSYDATYQQELVFCGEEVAFNASGLIGWYVTYLCTTEKGFDSNSEKKTANWQ